MLITTLEKTQQILKISKILVLILFPIWAFAQNDKTNILNNDGEICTVIYGSENITVNNNFKYFFPEDEIKKINKNLINFINKHDFLSQKEKKIFEKELNVDAKIKDFNLRIEQYQNQILKIEKYFSELDTLSTFSKEELSSVSQIITLAKTATDNAKCLSEDYDLEMYVDDKGNIVHRIDKKIIDADPNYIFVYPFKEATAIVRQYEKFGYINGKGEIIIPMKYDFAESFSEGKALVGLETFDGMRYFFVDSNHRKITPDLLEARAYKNGVAWAKVRLSKNEKSEFGVSWGYGTRQVLLNPKGKIRNFGSSNFALYDSLFVKDDVWVTKKNSKYGLLSSSGFLLHLPKFKNLNNKSDLFRAVQCENGAWGYLNENEKLYLRCLYTSADNFINGRAIISIITEEKKYWGVINKEGGKVVKPIFDKIVRKENNIFEVFINDESYRLNQYGVCIDFSIKKKRFKKLFTNN